MPVNKYTVTQVTNYILRMFRSDPFLGSVAVSGEVSNLTYHSSGHIYFSLKDENSVIPAAMFRNKASGLKFRLKEGMKVVAYGKIDVYAPSGRYQLIAEKIEDAGAGDLAEQFEKLKKELAERGLFAPEYKQPIPKYVKTLGVVTAPTGAALRDIINVSKRRYPGIQIVLYPALVQGEQAADSIVKGIKALEKYGVDLMIVGRGGGSMEDLWAFNEEKVAQAIFDCSVPIISAVGHETDTTIADYVADLRAPTPSAAAEIAVFDYHALMRQRGDLLDRLDSMIGMRIKSEKRNSEHLEARIIQQMFGVLRDKKHKYEELSFKNDSQAPENKLKVFREKAERYRKELDRSIDALLSERKSEYAGMREDADSLMTDRLKETRLRYERFPDRADAVITQRIQTARHRFDVTRERLRAVSPLEKISRGYGYLTDGGDKPVKSIEDVETGQNLIIRVSDGEISTEVKGTRRMTV